MVGVVAQELGQILGAARIGERAPRLGVGDQHLTIGAEHLCGLGHKVNTGKEDHTSVGLCRLDSQRERVAYEVGHLLHFGCGVVVSEDHSLLLGFECCDLLSEE